MVDTDYVMECALRTNTPPSTIVRPGGAPRHRLSINHRVNNTHSSGPAWHGSGPSRPRPRRRGTAASTHVHASAGGAVEGASPGQQRLGRITGEAAAGAVANAGGHHGTVLHLDDGGGAAHPSLGLARSRSSKWRMKKHNEECSFLSVRKKKLRYNYTLKNINLGYSNSESNLCVLWRVNKSINQRTA